jgi:hypothetical protein
LTLHVISVMAGRSNFGSYVENESVWCPAGQRYTLNGSITVA